MTGERNGLACMPDENNPFGRDTWLRSVNAGHGAKSVATTFMKITITINLENPGFKDSEGWECARILRDLADVLEPNDDLSGIVVSLFDLCGNFTGKAVVK